MWKVEEDTRPNVCSKCGIEKSHTEFSYKDKILKKRKTECKLCEREAAKDRMSKRRKSKEYIKAEEFKQIRRRYKKDKVVGHDKYSLIALKKILMGNIKCSHCSVPLNNVEDIKVVHYKKIDSDEVTSEVCCKTCVYVFRKKLTRAYEYIE